jgi:hypothetical protein
MRLFRDFQSTGSAEDLNRLGLGLVEAQRFADAARVFQRLVTAAGASQQSGVYRLSLASVYEDLDWYACSEYQLKEVVRSTQDKELRNLCRNQLEHLSELGSKEQANAEFQRLKFECAVENIELGSRELLENERLARATRSTFDPDPEGGCTARAQSLLERAAADYPGSTELLHALLHCCLVLHNDKRRDELMRTLEDLEPESGELSNLAANVAAGSDDPALPKATRSFQDLRDLVSADLPRVDQGLRLAAVSDLGTMAHRYACSSDICMSYAFGLVQTEQLELLRGYVDHLRLLERPEHIYHYNLCLILLGLGEREPARHHLGLAMRYATTPEEESDAAELEGGLNRHE